MFFHLLFSDYWAAVYTEKFTAGFADKMLPLVSTIN
jgi:hypothetical protein